MNEWQITLTKSAQKELTKLSPNAQELILHYLYNDVLKLKHPKLLGKVLRHHLKGYWRYRVNKFRIVCELQEDKLIVLVIKIAKRDVVYED